jgi:hypothetical protein
MWRLTVMVVPLSVMFLVAQAAVLGGTRLAYPGEYDDPFAPYETILPGQLVAQSDYPCDPPTTDLYLQSVHCEIHPDSSHVVSVSSDIFNGRFVQTWFRGHDLYVGDVVRRWGRPDVIIAKDDQYFYMRWNNRGLTGIIEPVGSFGRFHYMLPVERFIVGLQQFRNVP